MPAATRLLKALLERYGPAISREFRDLIGEERPKYAQGGRVSE